MDDSAHGDEPAEPNDAGSAKARPDTPLREHTAEREPVADAIPTVTPHPLRLPSQVPPWLEETVAGGPASDVSAKGDDAPSEAARDALEHPPEEPATLFTPEPSVSPSAEAADDEDGHTEAGAANRAPEPAPSAALELPAHQADAGDIGNRETHAIEPEPDVVAEPAQDAVFAAEDALPAHVEAPGAGPLLGQASVESSPPLTAGPEVHIEHDAPAMSDVDILPAPLRESVDNSAQPHPPVSELSVLDEGIWRDTAEARHIASTPATGIAARVIDTPPVQQQPPIPEEQIWSGPQQAIEPSLRWPAPEHADTLRETSSEADASAEPQSRDNHHTPQSALAASTETPAQAPSPVSSSLAAAWPSTSLPAPAPGTVGEPVRYLRLALRIAGGVILALTAAVLLLVVLYRWVDPPASTLMLGQQLTGTEIEQRWVPIGRMSPNLIQAVILSEDGGFCRHRGVDWPALEEAIESSRGGSTITMQVVKNLFLWPQRSYIRKALEIVLAYVVEAVWPKERVLEIYLNIAEWGPGIFGAEAAARSHFGRSASQLTPQEAALLAVSLPSPIDRRAGYPDQQMRRLANNLQLRMRAVRSVPQCVRVRRAGG